MDSGAQSQESKNSRGLPQALRWYCIVFSLLWFCSLLPLLFHATRHTYFERLWYYPPFYDFGCYVDRVKLLHTPAFWTADVGPSWDYPAPGIFIYKFFYAFNRGTGEGPHRVFYGFLAYLIFSAAVLGAVAVALARKLRRERVNLIAATAFACATVFLCWPVFFCLQRGNIELALDAGIGLGIWAAFRKHWNVAAVLLGVFGSAKLYPLVLLFLLLPARKWKQFGLGIISALVVTLVSAHYIGAAPVTAAKSQGLVHGLQDWVRANSLLIDVHRSGYDHSIYGSLKLLDLSHPEHFATLAAVYGVLMAVACLMVFATRFWRVPRVNQLLLLTVAAVLLPPTSFDYTLQLAIPAWALLLAFVSKRATTQNRPVHTGLLGLFAVLFAPETFVSYHGIMIAGQIKMLALVGICFLAMVFPLHETARDADLFQP